jgi:citrate lyase subunit beta/citryl-CoA lyase
VHPPEPNRGRQPRLHPSETEIAFAERVVAAFARAEAGGSAAIQLDGKFIDYPILYRAQRVLEKVAAIRARERQ